MEMLFPALLALLLPIFAFLAVYEATRGFVALRKGTRVSIVAIDFTAAAIMFALVAMILYLLHLKHWSFP